MIFRGNAFDASYFVYLFPIALAFWGKTGVPREKPLGVKKNPKSTDGAVAPGFLAPEAKHK